MKPFTDAELMLFKDILWRWQPRLLELLTHSNLTPDEREDLRGALSEEFVAHGLQQPSHEPNDYGLQIESLIDKVGRMP